MRFPIRGVLFAAVFLFAIAAPGVILSSQDPSAGRASFAAATIKPAPSVIPGPPVLTDDYFAWRGRTLKTLIGAAYRIRPWQIEGGPGWVDSQPWDVEARAKEEAPGPAPKLRDSKERHARLMLMLQSLLEDRFQLKIQRQTRQSPVYNLVVAKGGPKIKLDDGQSPRDRSESGSPPAWEIPRGSISVRPNSIEGHAIKFETLLIILLQMSDRPIIDCTNLKESYTFAMKWTLEDSGPGDSPLARRSLRLWAGVFHGAAGTTRSPVGISEGTG